jgi:hypothetical protein
MKEISKGDILTFKGLDNRYKAILCTSCYRDKSPYNFTFAALTFDSEEKPKIDNILETNFYGVGNIKDNYFKYSETERAKIWTTHPEIKPYSLGSYGLVIWRKDFMKFRDKMEFIGNINIVDNLDKNGGGAVNASEWNALTGIFTDKYQRILKEERGQRTFKVQSIVRD